MNTLSLAQVNEMVQDGDIDIAYFVRLAQKAGIDASLDQIKLAIGRQEDDADELFIAELRKIIS